MAKRRNVSGRVLRNSIIEPHEVAEFVAPRTMNEGLTIANVMGDVGENSPFAGAVPYVERELGLRDYTDDEVLLSAILGFPILNKIGGKTVHTLRDAMTPGSFATWKTKAKQGAKKLYPTEEAARNSRRLYNADEIKSSRGRMNASAIPTDQVNTSTVFGPLNTGATNTQLRSGGQQAVNTNLIPTEYKTTSRSKLRGELGYQGDDMYSPLRKPADNTTFGPWRTEASGADKPLRDNLNKLEDRWQFYVDDALGKRSNPARAEGMAQEAIKLGRPDIADRIRSGQKSGRHKGNYPPYASYATEKYKNFEGDMTRQMDHANRQAEKLIREQFAMTPDNLKEEFAQRYGTYDLLDDWHKDPNKWNTYKLDVDQKRRRRNISRDAYDRKYKNDIQR